jgi:hypothetical protein
MASSKRRIPDSQRELIRKRHESELDALADQAVAVERLAAVESRRVEVISEQDEQVAMARGDLAAAARTLVDLVGVEVVATLTGVSRTAVRRSLREADQSEVTK